MRRLLLSLSLCFFTTSTNAFALNVNDRVEYIEDGTPVLGTVTRKVNTQDGQEIVTVKLDGARNKVHGSAEKFKIHKQESAAFNGAMANIPIQLSQLEKELKHESMTRSAECSINVTQEDQLTIPMPKSYSINLMWINRTLNPDQKYLSTAKDEETLKAHLLDPVLKWAVANPEAEVSLWYDRAHATPQAIHNTNNVLVDLLEGNGIKNVRLRDVREIPIVKNNPDAFSDQTPIYYRVDMLKPIILVHSIESEKNDAAIFADLQVGDLRPNQDRMGKDELFKPSVMRKLNQYGLIHNGGKGEEFENQYLQLANNPRMISAIKHAIVNANLLRAENALNNPKLKFYIWPKLGVWVFPSMVSDVYNYYNLTEPGKSIQVRPDIVDQGSKDDPRIEYTPEKHGYLPFGNGRGESFEEWLIFDRNGRAILREDVTNLSGGRGRLKGFEAARKVKVRGGRHHEPNFSELKPGDPADGGDTYRVEFWK